MGYKIKRFSKGIIEFTHATQRKNLKSIFNEGLLGSKSHRKDSITNMSRNITGSRKDLVYLSNDGRSSKLIKEVCDDYMEGGVILHIEIPTNEFRKMKVVDNPELLGSKNYVDFIDKYKKKYKRTLDRSELPNEDYYDIMKNGTTVIEGDIPPEYIVESPKYNKI